MKNAQITPHITQVICEMHSTVYILKVYLFARISSGVCIIL